MVVLDSTTALRLNDLLAEPDPNSPNALKKNIKIHVHPERQGLGVEQGMANGGRVETEHQRFLDFYVCKKMGG